MFISIMWSIAALEWTIAENDIQGVNDLTTTGNMHMKVSGRVYLLMLSDRTTDPIYHRDVFTSYNGMEHIQKPHRRERKTG